LADKPLVPAAAAAKAEAEAEVEAEGDAAKDAAGDEAKDGDEGDAARKGLNEKTKNGAAAIAGDEPLPASWREADRVICIAGQSALDEVVAAILTQLLTKHGFAPRLMTVADVAAANLAGAKVKEAKLVCVSMLDAGNRYAYVRFFIRRVQRILPGVPILGGFWRLDQDDAGHRSFLSQLAIASSVRTLAEAIAYCLAQARANAAAEVPTAAAAAR
jgi:hypothetical protein